MRGNNTTLLVSVSIIFLVLVLSALPLISADISNTTNITTTTITTETIPKEVYFFYGDGCPHCANVEASGILEKVNSTLIKVIKYEIYHSQDNRNIYFEDLKKVGLSQYDAGVPLAIIKCDGNYSYLMGDSPIINKLEQYTKECGVPESGNISSNNPNARRITIASIIVAALIDSINPCAFGVLIFLMLSLMKIQSYKKALKAGLLYSFVVFIVYFLAGFGIFKFIQSFSAITHYIYLTAGVLVLIAGVLEVKDFFFYGKFITLRIPNFAKPIIEALSARASSIPIIILLGILVSLFELPCTGGIYLAILTIMSANKTFGISYLILYNLIFILPLIVLTILMYKGTKPETLQNWNDSEKRWMRLAAGLIMLALGIYILFF
jgi:cytochrome c biogenesis protein CcdA